MPAIDGQYFGEYHGLPLALLEQYRRCEASLRNDRDHLALIAQAIEEQQHGQARKGTDTVPATTTTGAA